MVATSVTLNTSVYEPIPLLKLQIQYTFSLSWNFLSVNVKAAFTIQVYLILFIIEIDSTPHPPHLLCTNFINFSVEITSVLQWTVGARRRRGCLAGW